jgi:hypothetical protein
LGDRRRRAGRAPLSLRPRPASCIDLLLRTARLRAEYAKALREHIMRYSLKRGDLLFGMFKRHEIENGHERAHRHPARNVAGHVPSGEG